MGVQLSEREVSSAMRHEESGVPTDKEVKAPVDVYTALEVLGGRDFNGYIQDAVAEGLAMAHLESVADALLKSDWCEFGRLVGKHAASNLEQAVRDERGW